MVEKKGWAEQLKAVAGKALRGGLPEVVAKGREAYEIAVKVRDWAEEHGVDLKEVYENASKGTVEVPEAVVNEYLEKSIRDADVDAVAVKCHDDHVEIMVTGKKFGGTYVAVADLKFTGSAIDKENHALELELLDDIQVQGKTLIAKVLVATTAFILRALFGGNLVEPEALESEFVSVDGKTVRVDLDRIEKLRPVLSGQVKGVSLFDLLVVKGVHEVPGALKVSVELGPLGRVAAKGIAFGKTALEKRKGKEG